MSNTPYERGQHDITSSLDAWGELGWPSMQDASSAFGSDTMEELEHAKEMLQSDDLSERQREHWSNHVEYFKGMLSRLD